jgi:hypothetical protein
MITDFVTQKGLLRAEINIATIFGPNVVAISARNTKLGYIFRILQHFAAKLCSFTNFSTLFPAIYFFCQDKKLVYNGNCLL